MNIDGHRAVGLAITLSVLAESADELRIFTTEILEFDHVHGSIRIQQAVQAIRGAADLLGAKSRNLNDAEAQLLP